METLLNKFKQSNRCEKCIEHFDPIDGCIFKCGHIYHTKCITSMENPCCIICKHAYNPNEIYKLSTKFIDKLVDDDNKLTKTNKKLLGRKAVDLLIESALLGHTESQYIIGIDDFKNDYMRSLISTEDGLFWLNKAANNKHLKAILTMMKKYKNNEMYYYYCELAADENDVTCQVEIAIYYEHKNIEKCLKYMNMAVKNNSVTAHRYMYYYYTEGKILPKDINLGYQYLSKVAIKDDKGECQFEMAQYYQEYDSSQSLNWYKLSVEKGFQPAQIELANYYLLNNEPTLAYKLLKKNQTDPLGMYLLGYYYDIYKQSYNDAFHWYTKSANKNIKFAQNKLYYFYKNGTGIEKNIDKSIDFLILAADNDCVESQLLLAQLYEIGFNYKGKFIQSDKKAKKYYNIAYKNGDETAMSAINFYKLFDTMK